MNAVRRMRAEELPQVLDWAAEEGWNPGLDDAEAFLAADPEGFFVAEADGAPVAAVSVVNHSERHAFLGLYLCRPAFRGRGLGLAVWQAGMAHAGDRVVGLDGVPAQQGNYQRSSFVRAGSTLRMEGWIVPSSILPIGPVARGEIAQLAAMETEASGMAKPAFLAAWLMDTETRQTLAMRRDGMPVGFVTIRRCRTGAKIGPLVAPDAEAAVALMRAAAAAMGVGEVMVDVPEGNVHMLAACEALGFSSSFSTARMYRGEAPPPPRPELCGVATLELG